MLGEMGWDYLQCPSTESRNWTSISIHVRHQLTPRDFARRLAFARWLIGRVERDVNFLRYLVIGDEAAFCMDGMVNTHNVRECATAGHPPEFNYDVNISRQKWTVWL